ncbi:clustered mitochondria protein homolog [Actinia tenebrosa]|uniref:Clustered mitochondria protein homolog n=1 Tax=Actinia tenebrosa TaxID=6105 RepID=A0A6P8HDI2_ACTTE|nr:clustered mitochondria protein homolog [Actinia tenebrosa]
MPSVDSSTPAEPQEENPEMMCPHLRKLAAQKESSKEEKATTKCPAEDKPEIKEDQAESEKPQEQPAPEIPIGTLTLQFIVPGTSEPVTAMFSLQDNVQDLRQIVLDRPESCYRTCFSLVFDGTRLDDFAELHMIEGLKDNCVIKIVEEPYTVREARIHLRRLKDLLSTSFQANAHSAVDNLSLSFLSAVTGADVEEEAVKSKGESQGTISTEECMPPNHVFSSDEVVTLLEPLYPANTVTKVAVCVKVLAPSSWNPPPGYRKLAGDLMYIDITTLEDDHIVVTSSTSGFFINKTSVTVFNPQPSGEPCRSHTLVGLLNQCSPLFRKNFAVLQKSSMKRHPLEVIPTPFQVFPWAVPRTEHTSDTLRSEDAAAIRIGYEEHMPGQLRDWNEELQSARELPHDTMQQRLLRERAIFKITSDFVAAATKGAMTVVDGNVMAINPGEEEKKRMFLWNNIFFSFAFDSREHYNELGGDDAAHAAANGDLMGVVAYNRVDVKGLFTLGTVIVDYRGYRVIAQSIIPGILQREQEQSVVYGSIDSGENVASHEKFVELLEKAGKSLHVRSHMVLDSNDEEVRLCSSIECKGIIGADGRHYILDLFRTFAPDANFSGRTEESKSVFPRSFKHKLCCLRPELIESFIAYSYVLFLKLVAMNITGKVKTNSEENQEKTDSKEKEEKENVDQKETSNGESNTDTKENITLNGNAEHQTEKTEETTEKPKSDKQESSATVITQETHLEAFKAAAAAVGSLSDREFEIRFNPDTNTPEVKHGPSEEKTLLIDKKLVKDASSYLLDTAVVKLIEDFINLVQTPLDGAQLTEILHNRGINLRYLGTIAGMVSTRSDLEHILKVCVSEMIARTAKQIFRVHMQSCTLRTLSVAVSHFLNCFLSSHASPQPQLPVEEVGSKKKKSKKKASKSQAANGSNVVVWATLTPEELWKTIVEDVSNNFGYQLQCDSCDSAVSRYAIQKISLLRSWCLKSGVQILLREYDFDNKKHSTFKEDDILNLFPIVKHTNPKAYDAAAVFEAANARLQAGFLGEAHELMVEALNLFHQVYGPLHPDIATCYRTIARLHYLAEDAVQSVAYQKKAVLVCERVLGVDHPDTIIAYVHLALYCHNAGMVSLALKLMYRARYLVLLVFGEGHPDMATFDSNIGLMLHGQREFKMSEKFMEKVLNVQLKYHGSTSIHTAMGFHLLARAKACVNDFRAALQNEKSAYSVYKTKYGDEDPRTKESSDFLKQCTTQAVVMQKKLNELAGSKKEASIRKAPQTSEVSAADAEDISRLMGLISGLKQDHPTPSPTKSQEPAEAASDQS